MDRSKKNRSRKDHKARKAPKVPIKTYRWEDIRRARKRGGYPWTHLYKGPFTEKIDFERFTMDAFRRAKSSSPMDRIDISEVSSWADYSGKTTPTLLRELISEPQESVSIRNSRPGSVVIEEYIEDDIEDDVQVKEFQTESAESSDNISQYLDKEEGSDKKQSFKKTRDNSHERENREKSEESVQRKRKLSAESSHSRYSFSNLGVVKKLQEAKCKIKIPKISFPTKKTARKRSSPPKEQKPKSAKKSVEATRLRKDSKPVYIHIPLKPPPGESDEFSYLESKSKSGQIDVVEKDVVVEDANKSPFSTLEKGPKVTKKPPLKINPAFKQLLKDVRQLKDKELANGHDEPITKDSVDEPAKVENFEESETSNDEFPKQDVFDHLFQASDTKPIQQEAAGTSRNMRSKSVEPPNKRRSSLESSYSRKSLSKLGIMKKLKEASEKIKGAFSMDSLKKKVSQKVEQEEQNEKLKKSKTSSIVKPGQLEKPKPTEPVYIHIPLKPPEGKTDEFSYLENEPLTSSTPDAKKEERTDSLDSTSPRSSDIQFIFLTPPSDDEILDKEPDIPETPSSSDEVVCFSSLKKLAQDAVDHISPDTQRKTLETVREESVSNKDSNMEIETIVEKTKNVEQNESAEEDQETAASSELQEKMVVDIEDGLSETPKTEDHLKSALKTNETASSVKKVSFKRKSRRPKEKEKDNGYETIETPKEDMTNGEIEKEASEDGPPIQSGINQSLSLDDEKTYLDQKIIKDTSLEEDYNKWKADDHEYEPVSPPSQVSVMMSSTLPNVTVMDSDTDPKIVISATEILDEPLEEKKKPFFQLGIFRKSDKEKPPERKDSSDTQSMSSQQRDLQEIQQESAKSPTERNKIQAVLRQGTEQLKTKTIELRKKIHNIHLPKTPEFKKPQFKRPKLNLHLPKIPDTAIIHLPHISLPGARKTTETRTIESRQFSTESNAGDSEQQGKRHKFDLSFGGTFPRFRKSKKKDQTVVFATVPRAKNGKGKKVVAVSSEGSGSIRIPLHSEDSMDTDYRPELEPEIESTRRGYEDRETSIDIARPPGHDFSKERALEVEYERENQAINQADYLSRWQRGNFKVRGDDEDSEEERIVGQLVEQRFGRSGQGPYGSKAETQEERFRRDEVRPQYVEYEEEEFEIRLIQNKHMVTDLDNLEDDQLPQNKDGYSSEGSGSLHRKGRLGKLDIDSDEFFVVHEIREGFQTPNNTLAQMNEYDPIGSNRSLPMQMLEKPELREAKTERKTIKKPKRKKTPHVSREEIPGDEESLEDVVTPSRPKRRSKRNKKRMDPFVPYQETIPSEPKIPYGQRLAFPRESLGILGDDEQDDRDLETYENEQMEGKEQTNIVATESHKQFQVIERQFRQKEEPNAPPRKHRSLKSLTQSENESILMDAEHIVTSTNVENQIQSDPPKRPSRRSRSQTSSLSRMSLPPSPRDTESILTEEGYLADNQQIPSYLIENRNYKTQQAVEEERQPCVEEPCVQDLRDYMGYAIVDKSKIRDPPLPPPRTPPRRRKREVNPDQKFATVPRNVSLPEKPPVRPLRNYSTLSHIRNGRQEGAFPDEFYKENKENDIDIRQYIEIDEDVNKDLVSGEIVQKMRQRPLPAPPRPPRKPKTTRKSLQDITSRENILQEETVSTQTEPLPPDFICEEIRQEPTDTIITPRVPETKSIDAKVQKFKIYDQRKSEESLIKRELITPTVYSFEETVTHGTLLVQPIDGAKVIPDHQLSRERLIQVSKHEDNESSSEISESFRQLKSPECEPELLTAKKLQVSDVDVDHLTVNHLLASKIVVSEIDAATISTNEIHGTRGPIKLGGMELSPQLFQQLVKQLETHGPVSREHSGVQKKTPTFDPSPVKPLKDLEDLQQEQILDRFEFLQNHSEFTSAAQREPSAESPQAPVPPFKTCMLDETAPDNPPRTKSKRDSVSLSTERVEMLEPDLDDQPPPRPPEPFEALYLPSQPPASFYALRARQFVNDNIPTAPKRKRHHSTRSRPVSRSRSTSDDSSSAPHRPARLPRRFSDSSIPELSGRLIRACGSRINNTLKRLIFHLTENLLRNADGKQDLHVFIIILLVLIAGLILLGYGEDRTVVHLHHWEYFNPPKDI